jgi:hypothetical protein
MKSASSDFAVVVTSPSEPPKSSQPYDEEHNVNQQVLFEFGQETLEKARQDLNGLDIHGTTQNKTREATRSPPPKTFAPPNAWAPEFEDARIFASVGEETRMQILTEIARDPFIRKMPARVSERIVFTDKVSALAVGAGMNKPCTDALIEFVRQTYFDIHDITPTEKNAATFGDEINDEETMQVETVPPTRRIASAYKPKADDREPVHTVTTATENRKRKRTVKAKRDSDDLPDLGKAVRLLSFKSTTSSASAAIDHTRGVQHGGVGSEGKTACDDCQKNKVCGIPCIAFCANVLFTDLKIVRLYSYSK